MSPHHANGFKVQIKRDDYKSSRSTLIRQATLEDAEALHQLDLSLSHENDLDIPSLPKGSPANYQRLITRAMSSSRTAIFLIAEVDGKLVGQLKCTGHRQKEFRHVATLDIAIHRDFRGQGIGTLLMQETVNWAIATGDIKRLELSVYASNEVALRLYKNSGFEVEGLRKKGLCHRGKYVDYFVMARLFFPS
jgi:RimJ/RimL family protein N-acetyltransferase